MTFSELLDFYETSSINRAAYLVTRGHHAELVRSGTTAQIVFLFTRSERLLSDLNAYNTDEDGARSLLQERKRLGQVIREMNKGRNWGRS